MDPELSIRDIAKETWVGKTKVAETIKEIPKSTDKYGQMHDKLDSIINDVVDITQLSLIWFKNKAKELSTKEVKDLSDIAKTNFERKQLLKWDPTNITKHEFNLEGKTMKELDEIRKNIVG